MQGSGPDEAKREPFIWSTDPKNKAQTTWEPTGVNDVRKTALSVEEKNPNSMYNWYKKLVYARRSSQILMDGNLKEINYKVDGVITFKREYNKQSLLVISNMSSKTKKLTLTKADTSFNKIYFETSKQVKVDQTVSIPAYTTVILSN